MPLSEIYNAVDPRGNILNPNLFKNIEYPRDDPFEENRGRFPDAYTFAKTFVSKNENTRIDGNGITSIDDPTYLGFTLRFDILSPLFNGATSANTAPAIQSQNPFLPNNSSLFSTDEDIELSRKPRSAGESAVGYLERIGEYTRAGYLRSFIQGIREINMVRPYYWQTITGLPEAWSNSFSMEDPFTGDKEGITIGCLEALDLKISALFNLYKAAVFDVKYKRTVLPKNLMYFSVDVDIHEIRKFKTIKSWLNKGNTNSNEDITGKLINENTATISFRFDDCIWDLTASNKVFEGVTNAGGNEMTASSMKWSYSKIQIESQFPGYNSAISDSINTQPKNNEGKSSMSARAIAKKVMNNAIEGIEETYQQTYSNLKKGTENNIDRAVRSQIQGSILGNAFGQRNQLLSAIRNPQSLINAVAGGALQLIQSNKSTVSSSDLGDKAFSKRSQTASLEVTNVFGSKPSGPAISSNNIFE